MNDNTIGGDGQIDADGNIIGIQTIANEER